MIDLCIVSHNAKDKTERMLESIYTTDNSDLFNVYIADNGSSDGSVELLTNLQDKYNFSLVLNPNVGYSAACNQLASLGQSEIIALLNCDIWFTPGSLCKIADSFNLHPDMGVLGPKQRDEHGRITHAGIVGKNTAPMHRGWQVRDEEDLFYRDFIDCVTVSGSAYFIRRSVWNEIIDNQDYMLLYNKFAEHSANKLRVMPYYWTDAPGGFLSTPHYYEETFCSYFVRHLGHRVCYDGSISIGHSWHGSHEKGSEMDKMFRISQAMFREACDFFGIERD